MHLWPCTVLGKVPWLLHTPGLWELPQLSLSHMSPAIAEGSLGGLWVSRSHARVEKEEWPFTGTSVDPSRVTHSSLYLLLTDKCKSSTQGLM